MYWAFNFLLGGAMENTRREDIINHTKKVHSSWKFKYRFEDIVPSEPCHKCGKHYWTPSDEQFCWACICCGNRIYFTLGAFHQQIDAILRSDRKDEYVYTEDSQAILPKKNNELKQISYSGRKRKSKKAETNE